jgi:hypothetical protein
MSNADAQSHRPKTTEIGDGGMEKKLRHYHREGGAGAGTDAVKNLEGEIAMANASHEERLKKARPQQSKTANR